MSRILNGSIDVTKIDKNKIVSVDKNGQPFKNGGRFINVTVFINDQADQYGNNASIAMNQSKEEREAGQPRIYLGNLKEVQPAAPAKVVAEDDGLPF